MFFAVIVTVFMILSALPLAVPDFPQGAGYEDFFLKKTGQVANITASDADVAVTAQKSVLIEAGSGNILFGSNERGKAGMASTTKIMTALVVLNTLPTDTVVTVPKEAVGVEGSSVHLEEGEKLTVEELLYGLLLESGNDCAVALAFACTGSYEKFMQKMNDTAVAMGITDTNFTNPHGLPDPDHYTSAYSLATITAEALKNDVFRRIVSTKNICISRGGEKNMRCLTNHNRLLNCYDGVIGVKTGYTKSTGRCLVSAAERGGVRLIAVTLNDRNDWTSHKNMLDYGFSMYERIQLAAENSVSVQVPVTGGRAPFVNAVNKEAAYSVVLKGSDVFERVITPHFLYAPVRSGDIVGYIEYYNSDGVLFYRLCLVATEDVEIKRLSFFEKLIKD
ncbi:MAG: D-alanyl-D-alanine carboxypeptidase [Eubacteriales bacterium]|nr:D-alanyl-D-alanine carboxypeptidase [Eubacteriales bacterium]MDD4421545.1 D-alanyl-D-alanine carboxypeptidase [Eubacteriales bacterium]HBR32816.1 D-alanyl-D-alanine carboxypeptidase [Clostridiales bacterium]